MLNEMIELQITREIGNIPKKTFELEISHDLDRDLYWFAQSFLELMKKKIDFSQMRSNEKLPLELIQMMWNDVSAFRFQLADYLAKQSEKGIIISDFNFHVLSEIFYFTLNQAFLKVFYFPIDDRIDNQKLDEYCHTTVMLFTHALKKSERPNSQLNFDNKSSCLFNGWPF